MHTPGHGALFCITGCLPLQQVALCNSSSPNSGRYLARLLTCHSVISDKEVEASLKAGVHTEFPPKWKKAHRVWLFLSEPLNVVDLVAILPFFVGAISGGDSSFSFVRIMRLIRVVRVMK